MLSSTLYSPTDEEFENSLIKLFCMKTHVHSGAFQEDATSKEECSRNSAWVDQHINLTNLIIGRPSYYSSQIHMSILKFRAE